MNSNDRRSKLSRLQVFRLRTDGSLFYFKDLGFLAPIVVTLAVVGLADLVRRAARGRVVWRAIAVAGAR